MSDDSYYLRRYGLTKKQHQSGVEMLLTVEEAARAIREFGWTVWVLDYNDNGTNYPIEDLAELASMVEDDLISDYSLALLGGDR